MINNGGFEEKFVDKRELEHGFVLEHVIIGGLTRYSLIKSPDGSEIYSSPMCDEKWMLKYWEHNKSHLFKEYGIDE